MGRTGSNLSRHRTLGIDQRSNNFIDLYVQFKLGNLFLSLGDLILRLFSYNSSLGSMGLFRFQDVCFFLQLFQHVNYLSVTLSTHQGIMYHGMYQRVPHSQCRMPPQHQLPRHQYPPYIRHQGNFSFHMCYYLLDCFLAH